MENNFQLHRSHICSIGGPALISVFEKGNFCCTPGNKPFRTLHVDRQYSFEGANSITNANYGTEMRNFSPRVSKPIKQCLLGAGRVKGSPARAP